MEILLVLFHKYEASELKNHSQIITATLETTTDHRLKNPQRLRSISMFGLGLAIRYSQQVYYFILL